MQPDLYLVQTFAGTYVHINSSIEMLLNYNKKYFIHYLYLLQVFTKPW